METDEPSNRAEPAAVMGILIVNKPSGITLRKLVDQVARQYPRSKVGHAGTLDPLASGILIVCVGRDPAGRGITRATQIVPHGRPPWCAERHARCRWTDRRPTVPSDSVSARCRTRLASLPGPDRSDASRLFRPQGQGPPRLRPGPGRPIGRAGPPPGPNRPDRHAALRVAPPGAGDRLWQWDLHPVDRTRHRRGLGLRRIRRDSGPHPGRSVHARTGGGPRTSTDSIDRHLRPALDAIRNCRGSCSIRSRSSLIHGRRLTARTAEVADRHPRRPGGAAGFRREPGRMGDLDPQEGWLQPRKVLI